jgi:hypothetical protein
MKSSSSGDYDRRHFFRALGSTFVGTSAVVVASISEAEAYDHGREKNARATAKLKT